MRLQSGALGIAENVELCVCSVYMGGLYSCCFFCGLFVVV